MSADASSIAQLAPRIRAGDISSETLTRACLERIEAGNASLGAFITVTADLAIAQAREADREIAAGTYRGLLHGVPISLKDIIDVAGQPTTAASHVRDGHMARTDAVSVQRLRAAGAVIVGRTNMTEFAFSGVGINPHYGTPRNPWDRGSTSTDGRVPGGSSSGAAVSITDGFALAAIGTDTGGSVRIPAAVCGVTGFKPSQYRVPRGGCLPLSTTLDSIGPLASSVADCALVDAVLAGEDPTILPGPRPLSGARLAAPQRYLLEGMDDTVARAYHAALDRLSAAGARIVDIALHELDELPAINAGGGFPSPEAWAWHRGLIESKGDAYDPRVRSRIERGAKMSAADYIEVHARRAGLIARIDAQTADFDALVMPTVPIVAPTIQAFVPEPDYIRLNMLMLRNPGTFNFLDRCAVSLPCHEPGSAPVGLMLVGMNGADRSLLGLARSVERLLDRAGCVDPGSGS